MPKKTNTTTKPKKKPEAKKPEAKPKKKPEAKKPEAKPKKKPEAKKPADPKPKPKTVDPSPAGVFGIKADKMPDYSIIPTPDGEKWEAYKGKWYKMRFGDFGRLKIGNSVMLIDPINFLPGEPCKCGRPKTELEKLGVSTYGDYIHKIVNRRRTTEPYGSNIPFADSHGKRDDSKPGLGILIRRFDYDRNAKVVFEKRSDQRVNDVILKL